MTVWYTTHSYKRRVYGQLCTTLPPCSHAEIQPSPCISDIPIRVCVLYVCVCVCVLYLKKTGCVLWTGACYVVWWLQVAPVRCLDWLTPLSLKGCSDSLGKLYYKENGTMDTVTRHIISNWDSEPGFSSSGSLGWRLDYVSLNTSKENTL